MPFIKHSATMTSTPSRDARWTSTAALARWNSRWTKTGCVSGLRSSTRLATATPVSELPAPTPPGTDFGLGFEYRPPLSENITIRGGAAGLQPGRGLRDLYNGRTLMNGFVTVKLQY